MEAEGRERCVPALGFWVEAEGLFYLPDPASLGPRTKGRTCIGVIARGLKDGQRKQVYIYNICDHENATKKSIPRRSAIRPVCQLWSVGS